MPDDSIFRQKGDGVPTGQYQEAVDADPSVESGSNSVDATPVWRQFVANADFQENNASAIAAEKSQQQRAIVASRHADQPEIWKGADGKLLRKVGRQSEMLDAADFVDHPTAGPEARKSLWDREKRQTQAEHEAASLMLQDPNFHAQKLKDEQRYEIQAKGDERARKVGPDYEQDPEYQSLKQRLIDDTEYPQKKQALEQRAYDAKVRAFQLGQTDPETWWQAKKAAEINANRQTIVQDAKSQHAQADEANASADEELAGINARITQGVKGPELPALQARKAEIEQAKAVAGQVKQAADGQLGEVKKAASVAVQPPQEGAGDFLRGAEVSLKQLPQLGYGVAGLIGATAEKITGFGGGLKDWGFHGYTDAEQKAAPLQRENDDVSKAWAKAKTGDIGALVDWAQYGLGYALGQMGETVAVSALGGLAGAAAGAETGPGAAVTGAGGAVAAGVAKGAFKTAVKSMMEKAIAKQALSMAEKAAAKGGAEVAAENVAKLAASPLMRKAAAKEIGSNVAIMSQALGMELGSIYPEAEKQARAEGRELTGTDLARVWGMGIAAGGVEGLTDKLGIDLLKGKFSGVLPKGRLAAGAVGGLADAAVEGGTEVLQTGMERIGARQSLTDSEAQSDYLNSGAMGALGGAAVGGVGGAWNHEKGSPAAVSINEHVNTSLAAIDPEAEPAAHEEIARASLITSPTAGADGLADGVLIERELAQVEADDEASVAAADQAVADATATGDKIAIKAAETARESVKSGRADTARAVLKIAGGQQLNDLTSAELASIGFKDSGDSFAPMTTKELKDAGITAPLIRSGADGSIILTDGALKKVGEISTRARDRVKMSESEAIQKAKERAATLATPEASGQATEAPAGSSSPASQSFDVPTRNGKVIRVSGETAAQAEEAAAASIPMGEDSIIPGQAKPVVVGVQGASDGEVAPAAPVVVNESPAGETQPAKDSTGEPQTGKKAISIAKGRLTKAKKKPKLAAALIVTNDPDARAEAKPDGTITINPERIINEAIAGGMTEDDAGKYFALVLDEEIRHAAQYDAARTLWKLSRSTDPLEVWRENHYAGIWASDFSGEKGDVARTLYVNYDPQASAADKAKAQAEWDAMSDGNKCMEAIRMMSQGENVTEGAKLWLGNLSQSLVTALKAALASLKKFHETASPTLKAEIASLEAALAQLKSNDTASKPRSGNPKTDSKKPAQSRKGDGNGRPSEEAGTRETPVDGGAQPPRIDGVGSPLAVGTRVSFVGADGEVIEGVIGNLGAAGKESIASIVGKDNIERARVKYDGTSKAVPVGELTALDVPDTASEWENFGPESGTLGIPRAEMPQVGSGDRSAMLQFMRARGIDYAEETVSAESLKPTQAEFSRAKVEKAKETEGDRALLVSSDDHLVDGHHQWLKHGRRDKVRIIRLMAPIREILDVIHDMPSVETADGSTDKIPDMKSKEEPASQAMEGNSVDTSSETKAPTTDEAIDNFAKNTRANLAAFEAETKRLHAEQSSAAETPNEAAAEVKGEMVNPENRRPAKEIKAEIIAQVEAEILKLPTFDHEFVNDVQRGFAEEQHFRDAKEPAFTTFSIPGDGTFKIRRTTKDLGELLAKVKRMPVDTKERAPSKSFPKSTLTKESPIKHADIILGLQDPDYRKQIVKRLGERETASREEIALRSEGVTREELNGQAPAQVDEPAVNPVLAAIEAKRDAFKPGPEAQAILDGRESPDDIAREEWRNAPLDPDAFGGANYPLVESQESSDETPAAEVTNPTPKPRKAKADKGPSRMELLENYFTVGKLLPNGDRVLEFATGEDGRFEVKVIREGEEGARERTHSTEPDNKTLLRAWQERETVPEATPAAESITDFGEKIGGARKDRWKDRGLVSDDLSEMTAEERHSYVTKAHVFGDFDYESMVDDGMPSEIAWLVKKIKDKVALVPDIPGKQAGESHEQHIGRVKELQGKYVELVGRIRDGLKQARSLDDINGVFNSIFPAPTDGSHRFGFDSKATNNVNASLVGDNHLIRAMQVGPYDLSSAKREVAKSGWPSKADSWKKKFAVRPKFKGSDIYENGQKVGVTESDSWYVITNAKRGWGQVVGKDFATEDDAINFAKEQGSKGSAGGTKITRPYNPDLKRTGPAVERGENVTEQDFSDAFGFRGGEFGKWTNAADRQQSLNQAYDGLMDLARVLGIPSKALSLNGALGIAFGARGGGKASAHYEPSKVVINLTKTRGAGTLAHEWAHAVDDHFGKIATGKAANYLSHAPRPGEVRPEVMKAWAEVMNSITTRQASTEATVAAATVEREKSVRNIKSWFRDIDTQVAKITDETAVESIKGDMAILTLGSFAQDKTSPDEIVSRISAALKTNGQKGIDAETRKGIVGNATWLERRNANLEKAIAGEISRQEDTDILAWSKKQGKSADNYWARLHELFARSFESYVAQTLEDAGETSPYLVQGVPTKNRAFPEWEGAYPLGRDAVAIHQAFKGLFDLVEAVPTEKGVSLRASELPMPEFREASNLKEAIVAAREFVNQPITNLDDGLVATASGNAITKMISQSAAGKSVSVTAHAFAIANLDRLFANSIRTHSGPDERGDSNLAAVHRYYAPFMTPDGVVLAKMTVKEFARESEGNRIYSVEAIDVVKPAGNWVASISENRRNYTPQAGFEEKLRQKMDEIKGDSDGLRASPLPESTGDTFKKRVPVSKPLTDEARRQQEVFGKNVSSGKLAGFGDERSRSEQDIVDAVYEFQKAVKSNADAMEVARKRLAADPADIKAKLLDAVTDKDFALDTADHLAMQMLINQRSAEAGNDLSKHADNMALRMAYRLMRGDVARTLQVGYDRNMTPAERALASITDAIYTPSKKVEKLAMGKPLSQRKAFFRAAAEARVKQVEAELRKMGVTLGEIMGENNKLKLANSEMMKQVAKLRKTLDQDILKMVQAGASIADIKRRYGKEAAETAQEVNTKAREELRTKIAPMIAAGMTMEQIVAKMGALSASDLPGSAQLTPEQIEAEIERVLAIGFGLPKEIPQNNLPRPRKPKPAAPVDTNPLTSDWSRPMFTDGLNSYEFDTKDRAGIMSRVESIRSLAGAMGKINTLTDDKLDRATSLLGEINGILAKYGTDAAGIFSAAKPIEDYRFNIGDINHVSAIARAISAIDADWIDKASEVLYANMLSGLQTMAVNATAIVPAAWETTVGRGVEMAINLVVRDPMAAQIGEEKYILRALGPAITRAMSNFSASFTAQHPMFDRDVLNHEVDWDKILGGSGYRTGGSISGKKGDIVRIPMRILASTDDFNRTLMACVEVGTFAYRIAKAQGMKPGSPEFDRFLKVQVNTPGSMSYELAAQKASRAIFSNALPGQKDNTTGKMVPVNDIGDLAGWAAASLNKFASQQHENMFAKAGLAALRISFFPFQRTPFNILRKGVRYTLNPFSLFDIGLGIIQNSRGTAADGTTQWKWNANGRNPELIERFGQQLQGAILMALLAAAGAGEGDDDDQDKPFVITGSAPFTPQGRAEREAQMRSGIGPYRISFRRKDGSERFGFNYGRLEPLATTLAASIDLMKSVKRAQRGGKGTYDAASEALGGLASQAQDKSFMKGISDLVALVTNLTAQPDLQENRKFQQFLAGRVAMVIPNIIKQPIREADGLYRERSNDFMQELLYQVAPYGQKEAKIDPYGRQAVKTGNPVGRVVDVTDAGTDQVHPVDAMLLRFRDKHPGEGWFPSPIVSAEFKHPVTGKSMKMSEAQLAEFRSMAGKRTDAILKREVVNFSNPSMMDVEKVKQSVTQARSEVKKMLAFKFARQ